MWMLASWSWVQEHAAQGLLAGEGPVCHHPHHVQGRQPQACHRPQILWCGPRHIAGVLRDEEGAVTITGGASRQDSSSLPRAPYHRRSPGTGMALTP